MSDSELSDAPSSAEIPSDSELEKHLRKEVRKAAKANQEASVKTVRTATEQALGLPEGFFKSHADWKDRSKSVILDEHGKVEGEDEPSTKPAKAKAAVGPRPSSKKEPAPRRPLKRGSLEDGSQPRKKGKKSAVLEDENLEELSSPPSDVDDQVESEAKVGRPVKKGAAKKAAVSKPAAKSRSKPQSDEDIREPNNMSADEGGGSESELSVVLDDAVPSRKRRGKSKDVQDSKKSNVVTKPSADTDPDKEEIKKLQGWLVKCGVRKVWGKELKPYETSKAKIKHLKSMLSDVGMNGRFSNEKAAQIKEARELAADIEAVQEGAQRWGKSDGDEDAENEGVDKTRSGRRLVRGAQNYDFLSSDGEETD